MQTPAASILSTADYSLARLSLSLAGPLREVGDWESSLLARHLAQIKLERPLFIAGLARSGTTTLLTALARAEGVVTHRYADFPFVFTPWLWSRLRPAARGVARERPHGDRIHITLDSPEAFEEPIWQYFFPQVHDPGALHGLSADQHHPAFEAFFRDHLRKMLWLGGGRRYLSKANYNIARLDYLARLFDDGLFLVPVRHPLTQVRSLVRQHRRFSAMADNDPRIGVYLRAAGHYEFGPQRVPVQLSVADREAIQDAWTRGEEARGYAIQWASIYKQVLNWQASAPWRERLRVLRYERLCEAPLDTLRMLSAWGGLDWAEGSALESVASEISAPAENPGEEADTASIWAETAAVAETLGYSPPF